MVARATPHQVVGLVQVVASVGPDHSETSTGMVLTADGEVVTSDHGVVGAVAITATLQSSGRTYVAHLVAQDATHDVALLRLQDASALATVRLATRTAGVGDRVVTVGHAGRPTSTFTAATGGVLATDQTLVAAATATTRAERLTGLLLSSSDALPGMSGGPTYDARGEVVGMTTAAVSTGDGLDSVAIPVGRLRLALTALAARSR